MPHKVTRSLKPVALVTGASTGIGQACAEELARAGLLVFGTSRHPRSPRHRMFRMLTLDVRDDASVEHCVEEVHSKTGRIDVLVNNAGVAAVGALEEIGLTGFKEVMDTNLLGVVRMMQAVLPIMRRQRRGRIVNMGSIMAFLPMPYSSAYCASKHALRGLSESVDHEVRGLGIRVISIEPGFIRTDIVRHSPVAGGMEPYATARAIPQKYFQEQIDQGEDPAVVARVVVQAATAVDPQTMYWPDSYARLIRFTRGVLPDGWFDSIFRHYFGIN